MKKMIFALALAVMAISGFSGCKSHKSAAIVNAKPQFETDVVWKLTNVRDKSGHYDKEMSQVTIRFNPEAGTVSGNSACNRYFGNYKCNDEGKLTLSQMNSTKMACPEPQMKMEHYYLLSLSKVDGYKLTAYTLELLQGDKVLLSFEKAEE